MPLDESRCEVILNRMKSMDIQTKLNAINEAKTIYPTLFPDNLDDAGYAKSAMIVTQLYNIIREELQVKLVSVRANLGEPSAETSNSKPKTTVKKEKPKAKTMDMGAMMAAFMEMKKEGKLG